MLLPYKICPEFDIYQNKSKTRIIRDTRLRGELNTICDNLPDMITSGNMVIEEGLMSVLKEKLLQLDEDCNKIDLHTADNITASV